MRKIKKHNGTEYISICAPYNFSLIDSPQLIIHFFELAGKELARGRNVQIDLTSVERFTVDAIALLIGSIKDFQITKGRLVEIIPPQNPALRSRYNKFVVHKKLKDKIPSSQQSLFRVRDNRVANETAKQIVEVVSRHLFGRVVRLRPLYEVLIELMANAHNHATLGDASDWYFLIDFEKNGKTLSLVFFDLGVGIFDSFADLKKPVRLRPNSRDAIDITLLQRGKELGDVMTKINAGESWSRTGEKNRGRGLPMLMKHAEDDLFSEFKVLANDAYIDFKRKTTSAMNESIGGTMYCFEVDGSNLGIGETCVVYTGKCGKHS